MNRQSHRPNPDESEYLIQLLDAYVRGLTTIAAAYYRNNDLPRSEKVGEAVSILISLLPARNA